MRAKKLLIPLILAPAVLLASCSEIMAYPDDYDDPLVVNADGSELDPEIYNNIMSIIYDAMHDGGTVASDVLDEILYQLAISVIGEYDELEDVYNLIVAAETSENTYSTVTAVDEFIDSHSSYWVVDSDGNRETDSLSKTKEYIRVRQTYERIQERISESFYEEITAGSYLRNGYFYETDYLMSLRNSVNSVASPFTYSDLVHDKYLIIPEIGEEEVFSYDWGDGTYGLLTYELYENEEEGFDYVSRNFIPEIYRNLLVEQYLFDNNYSTLGRSYAREVSIIGISNRTSDPLLASNLMNAYVDTYINTDDHELATSASFDIITAAWRGIDVPEYDVSTTTADSDSVYAQAAYLLNEAGATYTTYEGTTAGGFVEEDISYWKGTSYGDLITDLSKVNKDPLLTDSTIEETFTNSGEYTVAQGLEVLTNSIKQESYITEGWYIRNGGLDDLGDEYETIRTRLFNIGVANALDNDDYPDRFTYDSETDSWVYDIPDNEGNYVAKIHGRYFLKPTTRENTSTDNVDYTDVSNRLKDILWSDSDGNYILVEITQAVSTSKLARYATTNYESLYEGLDGFMLMEEIAHEVAEVVASNDSYKTLSTLYWLENADILYHDEDVYEYFYENYPDLFEDDD